MNSAGSADVPVGPIQEVRDETSAAHARSDIDASKCEGDVGAYSLKMAGGDAGAPEKEWTSRGYLPHRDRLGLLQSITFRLADSLPQSKLLALREELRVLPEAKRSIEERKRIEKWLDAGRGCCALKHPAVARYVEQALLHFDGERYALLAWCIMPNHVHVLIEPRTALSSIVQSWKSFTGHWALKHNAELELGVPGKAFWQREYWDRFIRNEKHLWNVVDYIHENPVKAGLCASADAWKWSSAGRSADVPVGIHAKRADGDAGAPGRNNL